MKVIHTADVHLGQIIYQNYDRVDEHDHFFKQLKNWCAKEHPDALLVSGDVFDMSQPSATVRRAYTDRFVEIHKACPEMAIVIIAGNHDSASRIQEDSSVWKFANAHVVGLAPTMDENGNIPNWKDFVVETGNGYVVALPFSPSDRSETIKYVLDKVAEINTKKLPVVLMGHLAATGADVTGHNFEIGTLSTQDVSQYSQGYDYLALGHIHKPQTIGHEEDAMKDCVTYPSGVARYSGSALHVSCDEAYPHTVSVVEIPCRGGDVNIRQLRIDELRHFYVFPSDGTYFHTSNEALKAIQKEFAENDKRGYFRLRLDHDGDFPSNFNDSVYKTIEIFGNEARFNPKHIWSPLAASDIGSTEKPVLTVPEIQETDPLQFVLKSNIECAGLTAQEIADMFAEVAEEVERIEEESQKKSHK